MATFHTYDQTSEADRERQLIAKLELLLAAAKAGKVYGYAIVTLTSVNGRPSTEVSAVEYDPRDTFELLGAIRWLESEFIRINLVAVEPLGGGNGGTLE